MKILIEYDSSWRNSFLDGSNNEALPKKGRNFIGSMTKLRNSENFIRRDVTLDTVMGVLNRLIGDQRKLYQARNEEKYGSYYFKKIEELISFDDKPSITHEITYIRNMTGSTDQNAFTGAVKVNDVMFTLDYANEFWGVLALDFDKLCEFIIDGIKIETAESFDPLLVIDKLEELNKQKTIENIGNANKVVLELYKYFPDTDYLNKKGEGVLISLYCSSLYLQLERLAKRFDMSPFKTKAGGISGISKRGFTKKDFMDRSFSPEYSKKYWE
jgi:hypothetical protein